MSIKITRRNIIKRATQTGFTLIEVLISLAILAVGLLGMTALQNEALKYNQAAFLESQALFLMNDMAERIRANSNAFYGIDYDDPVPVVATDCSAAACTPNEMRNWDIAQWRNLVTDGDILVQGEGQVNRDNETGNYFISIRYDWSQLGGVDLTDGKRTVSILVRI